MTRERRRIVRRRRLRRRRRRIRDLKVYDGDVDENVTSK